MGRRTEHTSGDADGRGGPILSRVENGPQHVYNKGRGGPVHHMMAGPQHVTRKAKREKLLAQSRTQIAVEWDETLTVKKKTQQHEGMDSDLPRQIPSPSSHFLHRIY